jgi:hypothetical protein
MKPHLILLLVWPAFAACTDRPAPRTESKKDVQAAGLAPAAVDSNLSGGYSLLAQLMEDEREVDMIFLMKDAPKEVAETVKEIARFSKEGKEKLAELTRGTGIALDRSPLPKIEKEAREAIARTTAGQLVGSGEDFPKKLLLTQVQAMNYMAHLAQVLAAHEKNNARRQFLRETEATAQRLHARVVRQLID